MNHLLSHYLDDRSSLTEEQLQALVTHLEQHPADLVDLRAQLALDDMLARRFDDQRAVFVARIKQAAACNAPPDRGTAFIPEVLRRAGLPNRRSAWLQWRPLTAAAAGIALGLVSASMVLGYIAPHRMPPEALMMVAVAKGSFEGSSVPVEDDFPSVPGRWGADACRVTGADQGIVPVHGLQMLRLEGAPSKNARGKPTLRGDCYQIVDLRPSQTRFADGCANLKFSAWFNAVAEQGPQDYTARIEVYACHGNPASCHPEGDVREWLSHEQIATAQRQIRLDRDPSAWQVAATSVELPAEADYVVLCIHVAPARPVQAPVPATFPGLYVDCVRLALIQHARPSRSPPLPSDSEP